MDGIELSVQPTDTDGVVDDGDDKDGDSMYQERCAKLKGLRKYLTFERMVVLKTLTGQLMHVIDLALDISVTVKFYTKGEVVFAVWSCCFIIIPYLCNVLLSLLGFVIISKKNPGTKKPWCALIVLHALPIVPALWYAPPTHLGPVFSTLQTKRTSERKGRLANFTVRVVPSLLIFTECFVESIPQFLIQSFNLLTSPFGHSVDILTVISSVFSLFTISWASSGLWFTVREQIYFPCPCKLFQISSLLYYLSNLFMLSGRLIAVSAFAASVGLLSLLYVLLAHACIAVITDVAVNWGHVERSKLSKENVVPRLVEFFGLLFDIPFSITFMLGPARIGCYCLWALETLLLDVFAFCWLSRRQPTDAPTVLEASAGLRIALLILVVVFATAGITLRYLHFRQELKDLRTLDQNICEFGEMLKQNEYLKEELRLAEETCKKAQDSMESEVPDGQLIVNSLHEVDKILNESVTKASVIATKLSAVNFAKELEEDLRQIQMEAKDFTEQFTSTGVTEDWAVEFIPIPFKLSQLSMELEDLSFYFQLNSRLHKTSGLGVYQKILDAFAANIFVGNECLFVDIMAPLVNDQPKFPHLFFKLEPKNVLQKISFAFFPVNNCILDPHTRFLWPTRRDAFKQFQADIIEDRIRIAEKEELMPKLSRNSKLRLFSRFTRRK